MAKVKIVDKREMPAAEPARMGRMDVIITYQVDPMRTYITSIPQEEFTEEALAKKIAGEIKEREAWTGKEIELP